LLKVALITIYPTNHSCTVEPRCLELEGTTRKYSSYPRFDLSEIDYDVSCFIDKGSDVCFHHVWKCVKYIFDCHIYRLRFVRYVLDVFFLNERINKEISIHKTFIYYSINLIFNKNECELFKRNKKNDITNCYQSRFQ
jgi:hypothetical protein